MSTLAGTNSDGRLFSAPRGLAVDTSGNVYVADTNNYRIRKVTPGGVVSTLAGSSEGQQGFVDGAGSAARFTMPMSLTVDGNGNVFVADGNAIRKITPTGVVSTFAGSQQEGFIDGPAASAMFRGLSGIVAAANGNIYVSDGGNFRIRKITPTGVVSTLAGNGSRCSADGVGASACFNYLDQGVFGLGLDGAGNIYVNDLIAIRKVTSTGVVTTLVAPDGENFYPIYVLISDNAGNIYYSNGRVIRKLTTAGELITIAGTGEFGTVDGPGGQATFGDVMGIAVDLSGSIYVSDASFGGVRKITPY